MIINGTKLVTEEEYEKAIKGLDIPYRDEITRRLYKERNSLLEQIKPCTHGVPDYDYCYACDHASENAP